MGLKIKNVLISDAVDESCVKLLQANNINVTCLYKLTPEQLIKEIPKYDGLVVRSDTKVTSQVLQASNLLVVGRAGTGVDNIDVPAATRKGVIVLNAPGGNFISACELTCSLITCLSRHVAQGCQSLKEGKWDRKLYSGTELSGKTLAVLGLGKIGREVAIRMQAFGMKVIGFDPMVSVEDAAKLNITSLGLDSIWPQADYITVHTPLIPQTRNLINADVLKRCKKGVRIINVARGGIIDEKALLDSLKCGHCGGAAIDVFCEEPPKSEETFELIRHPKVICTPHLGASTEEAQIRVAVEIAEQFIALAETNPNYTAINGVLNAPALAASRNPENNNLITLAKYLGKIAGSLLQTSSFSSTTFTLKTLGDSLKNKQFLTTPAQIGLLSGRTSNGLNFINVNTLANEGGLKVNYEHGDSQENEVALEFKSDVVNHKLLGTVRNNVPYLVSIDNAVFKPSGVVLNNQLLLRNLEASEDLSSVINELVAQNIAFYNIAVARGQNTWVTISVDEFDPKKVPAKFISLAC
uniref:D-3-phosphoglycerate dehydrogenase n=1 Tax=Cacopsylla melanoneura TaxID=428564 RepID=A0A8D9BPM5_9HEMI